MTSSAAVSSDLQEKKGTDDANDALKDHNHGSSSGTKTLNVGLQTGTSRGDTDQTAVGQLSATKAVKRPRNEIDKRHYEKKKGKLKHYDEMCIELEKKNLECENSRKNEERMDQQMQQYAKWNGELEAQASSFMRHNENQNQHIQFLSRKLEEAQVKIDTLEREKENFKFMKQQQSVGMTQQQPGGMIQEQPGTQQDGDDFFNGLLSSHRPSQPIMQTDGGESEMHTWDN